MYGSNPSARAFCNMNPNNQRYTAKMKFWKKAGFILKKNKKISWNEKAVNSVFALTSYNFTTIQSEFRNLIEDQNINHFIKAHASLHAKS